MKKVLVFAGSNSKKSINQILAIHASQLLDSVDINIISLTDFEAPIYGIDLEMNEGFPKSMIDLYNLFQKTDGFIIGVPEHNGSMPAVMKNTLDWVSRQGGKIFQEKPVVFLGTSPGKRGGISAMNHVLDIMPHRGAIIIGHYNLPNFNDHYTGSGLSKEVTMELSQLMNKFQSIILEQ